MAFAAPALRPRQASLAVPVLAVAFAIVAIVAVHRGVGAETTYAGVSLAAHAADLAAGLGLLAAGLVAWFEPRARRLGILATFAAVAWFAPDLEGWDGGPGIARSLGAATAPLFLAFLFHLVLASPRGRLRSRLERAAVVAAYGIALTVTVGRALFRDPYLDPYCWRNCFGNSLLVHADQGVAQALSRFWLRSALVIGVLLAATCAWRLLVASGPARGVLAPMLCPGLLVGAAEAAYAVALLRTPLEDATSTEFSAIFFARSLAVGLLALGLAWTVVRERWQRATVLRLSTELGAAPPPGKLRDTLAAVVGDPALEVAYWLPGSRRFVDAQGRPTDRPAPGHGRAVTPIEREGRPVAIIVHDAALLDSRELASEVGSAARLAVENERLQAEVLAQLYDLRTSQARIVETGDAERRRLERNLHDGAQQRLLAVSYDLRLARAGSEGDGDAELSELLASAVDEVGVALEDLRELAHGIYPAVLTEAGLGPALASLADSAPLPVELGEITSERYSPAIETAAYVTAAEAISDAKLRSATSVSVGALSAGEELVVTAVDDGVDRGSAPIHVADRVGALGGSLEVEATTLRAVIPCA
jgi:signal transduction histidine kinase